MPFKPRNGIRGLSDDQIRRVNPSELPRVSIEYTAGNAKSTNLDLAYPTTSILCNLRGTFTVASANATLNWKNVWALIRKLSVKLNVNDAVVEVPGWYLPKLHHKYFGHAPLATLAGATQAAHAFSVWFELPIDCGDYFSPIAEPNAQSLALWVDWGVVTDMATAGEGGTIALSGVNLDVWQNGVIGATGNEYGSVTRRNQKGEKGYLRHTIMQQELTVAGASTRFEIRLQNDRLYSAIDLMTLGGASAAAAAPVNTILNSVKLNAYTSDALTRTAAKLKAMQWSRYQLTADWLGFYAYDMGLPDNADHMITFTGPDRLLMLADVATPETFNQIIVIEDLFEKTR